MTKENNISKVKAVCPLCKQISNIPRNKIKSGIVGMKCRPCFNERSVFVNLQLTYFELQKANNAI